MTVVVGFVTEDASVMASDTEWTNADGSRSDGEKIWTCGSLLLGYTGTTVVSQPLRAALDAVVPRHEEQNEAGLNRWEYREAIRNAVGPVLAREYEGHVGAGGRTRSGVPTVLAGMLLAIGRDDGGYWMLELDESNGGTFCSGFHAVGSGSLAAQVSQALLAHYAPIGTTLPHLRVIAHRTVSACIGTLGSGFGVGGHVAMWQSGADGFEQLDDPALQAVAAAVEAWTVAEAETLNRAIGGDDPEGTDLPASIDD